MKKSLIVIIICMLLLFPTLSAIQTDYKEELKDNASNPEIYIKRGNIYESGLNKYLGTIL